jgi:hypothetical protein
MHIEHIPYITYQQEVKEVPNKFHSRLKFRDLLRSEVIAILWDNWDSEPVD